ncbi:hypothetical protein COU49_01360 [Candidatus Nomurabacteria bacterium CG10_big_fil_rev_8_21_14_0_10_35_16]|uniref:Uncharacterized protein n=1 Tax=Candidatus Nomurabacteria bacterium CG10_big_fil_rev_8_21_14_0_10_35_16 TaxID=1974731 RepID=A0A2H0TBI4_9BACT|nr:MAG: hypothetical protein COU49_01360 [Candidatus Nomurabacteria bacterium CG10_big_fil_rev_8_21_14_0_10_35_16]
MKEDKEAGEEQKAKFWEEKITKIKINPMKFFEDKLTKEQEIKKDWEDMSEEEMAQYSTIRQQMVEYQQRIIERIQKTIRQINEINAKYDALLAKLE